MSLEATTWALTSTVGDARMKLVLYGLANHAHADGRHAWVGKPRLAEYAECDVSTVKRQLRKLVRDGWIRLGDQQQVAHLRPDRRPTVYDLAMTDAVRDEWAAEQASPSPHDQAAADARGGIVTPRPVDHGGSSGGSSETPRGVTAVTPEPYLNPGTPPNPLASEGEPAAGGTTTDTPGCAKHSVPARNCRACGTSARPVATAAARAAGERRRAEQRAADAARRRQPPPDPAIAAAGAARARAHLVTSPTGGTR